MLLFIVFTALYFSIVLFVLIRRVGKVSADLTKNTFISREHTDAIKGIVAVGIMISHIAAQIKVSVSGPTRYYVLLCTTLGGIGVNLFFFASGFGNYYSARNLNGLSARMKWLLKRTLSIAIVFSVCFVLTSVILCGQGYYQTFDEVINRLLRLRMPLTKTWYLKVQILLYIILVFSLFFKKKVMQEIILVGLCFISSLIFYRLGYTEEWWKSTMCFVVGYYCAMYKEEIRQLLNRKKKLQLWMSIITIPVFFVMACLLDNFWIKLIGNTFLMASMLIVVENFQIDNCIASGLGNVSLEIYLIHISLSAWFLRNRVPDTIGIIQVVLWTAIVTGIAKIINDRILTGIEKIS